MCEGNPDIAYKNCQRKSTREDFLKEAFMMDKLIGVTGQHQICDLMI